MKRYSILVALLLLCLLLGCAPKEAGEDSASETSQVEISASVQDNPAASLRFSGGLDLLLAEEYNENQRFDVVIRITPEENWSVEQEQAWLDSFGFSFSWDNDHFHGRETGTNLQSFPKHQSCSYEIIPTILYESTAGKELLCLGDEAACQAFLDENDIVIPEEYTEIVTARAMVMHAEMNPHTPLGISHAVLYDLGEAVRAAVLNYHGLSADDS